MVKQQIAKILSGVVLALTTTLSINAFKPNQTDDKCLIVVGIASKDFKCQKGDDKVAYPTHAGYQAVYHTNSDNYYNTANYVKTLLRDKFKVPDKNMTLYSSDKSTCVIISYRQEIKEWKCTVVKCAVGFGESKDAALANAVAQKNSLVGPKVPYLEMDTFNCPE